MWTTIFTMYLLAFLDIWVQILGKQLPCDQNLHRILAYICRASSKHISSFHMAINPAMNHECNKLYRYYIAALIPILVSSTRLQVYLLSWFGVCLLNLRIIHLWVNSKSFSSAIQLTSINYSNPLESINRHNWQTKPNLKIHLAWN